MADNFTFFTLVRDPLQRFASSYTQALMCVHNLDPNGDGHQGCQKVQHEDVSTLSAMLTIMEVSVTVVRLVLPPLLDWSRGARD